MPQVAGSDLLFIFKMIAVAVITSLIMQAIFKPPKPSEAVQTNSYLFAGTQNVTAQGVPVPLGYGRLRVGSVVISAATRHYSRRGQVIEDKGPIMIGKPIRRHKDGHLLSDANIAISFDFDFWRWHKLSDFVTPDDAVYSEEFDVWYYPDKYFWKAIDEVQPSIGPGSDWWTDPNAWTGLDPYECWIAREVYGINNPSWLVFRFWLLNYSPNWFCNWYIQNGKKTAEWISRNTWIKPVIRRWMDARIKFLGKTLKDKSK